MPSSHIQNGSNGSTYNESTSNPNCTANGPAAIKSLPPPSKLPPPPPPPPKNTRPLPPPPPPPPPRNSSQLVLPGGHIPSQFNSSSVSSVITSHNNGPSSTLNSVNSIGRCASSAHGQTNCVSNPHNHRSFTRHGDCGSRSSISSHGSSHHYHHGAGVHNNAIIGHNGSMAAVTSQCDHQVNLGCSVWSPPSSNLPLSHPNSNSLSDNGICNSSHSHPQDMRASSFQAQCTSCCGHHAHAPTTLKCQSNTANGLTDVLNTRSGTFSPQNTIIGRGTLFPNSVSDSLTSENCCPTNKAHVNTIQSHHHHLHHHHHEHPLNVHQPDDDVPQGPASQHRCGILNQTGNLIDGTTISHQISNGNSSNEKQLLIPHQCGHVHRINNCNHHHQQTCLEHHANISSQQQQSISHHSCRVCPLDENLHHECNTNSIILNSNATNSGVNDCPHNHHHHAQPCRVVTQSKCLESIANESAPNNISATAHVHNLSNSSTTTHTSNVAVKQPQLQFNHSHRPLLSRGGRSSSSQHYEQYGLSSAASTSSATASLSSYHAPPTSYDDAMPSFLSSKSHQPLPPPPYQHNHMATNVKSRPASPTRQIFNHNNNNNVNMPFASSGSNAVSSLVHNINVQDQQQPQILPPPPPLPPLPSQITFGLSNQPLPPLPPKPVSPNASSCSTQITTVRTSPSLQNQPITRITSHAGVQSPLPSSDVPPPLPPLNLSSRTQPLVSALMTKITTNMAHNVGSQPAMNLNMGLNYNRGGIFTDAERKTELLTRQVELEMEQRQKSGDPLGICPKCSNKVMPFQEACKAMSQIFHANCFVCCECGRTLLGKTFYPVGDKVYCEEDFQYTGHMKSLEKCASCSQPIFNMILPALGRSYHPKCFKCCICGLCLDGIPFTVDKRENVYCVEDYHNIYSPKCAACGKSISPIDGTGETVRVVSMDKDYHVDCYCCEDCGLQLTDEEPSRSYPLDNHLLCQKCHINKLTAMKAALSLE